MDRVLVEARGLSRNLAGRPVLSSVSFSLRAGRSLVVMGANGAGKSTLLQVLGGILGYQGGVLMRFGTPACAEGIPDGRIGYLGHKSLMYPNLTLAENLQLYGRLWRIVNVAQRIDTVVRRVDLAWWQHEPLKRYSQGMRQRAAWARLLLIDAQLWLLDEPWAGLDPDGRQITAGLLRDHLARGGGAVVTTHRWEDAQRLGHMAAVLESGRLAHWRELAGTLAAEEQG